MPSRAVVWAAGVRASDLAAQLAEQIGTEVDKAGRVIVEPDLSLRGHPEVFAIGDMVSVSDGHGGVLGLPGLAPVAIQQGHYVAKLLQRRRTGAPPAVRSGTSTRATWRRSGVGGRWPTWVRCTSAGCRPG